MTNPSPDEIRMAEQHRLLWAEYGKLNAGFPAYLAIAGAMLALSGMFGQGGQGADHPMFLLGAGIVLFIGAGSYWLWVRSRMAELSKEMSEIEARLRTRGLRVWDGNLTTL